MSSEQNDSRTVQSVFPQALDMDPPQDHMRLGWRILLTLVLLVAIAVLGLIAASRSRVEASPAPSPVQQSVGEPLVLAFYYPWFDENTWSSGTLSDLPSQPYISRDRAAMGRHIEQAKAAGIDAFLVAWYGPDGQFNQTEPNLTALLAEAGSRNFRIGILFETDSPFFSGVGSVTGALQHAANSHMQHPAYLRVDGRPVTFFWRPQIYGVETWRSIRSQVDPGYQGVWVSEGVDTAYLSVFDGHHLYSNTWNPPSDLTYTNQKFANLVAAAGVHKLWVATAMPGYNDVAIRPGNGFVQDREGGGYYTRSWQAAMASQPDWIVINSFNEWPEGTYVEPSAAYGDHYLGLTAGLSQQFKAREQTPAPANPDVPTPEAQPTPLTAPDEPTAYVEASLLNVRAGPGTEFPVLTMVASGDALPIRGASTDQPDWWQIETGGQLGWVSALWVRTQGPTDEVVAVE